MRFNFWVFGQQNLISLLLGEELRRHGQHEWNALAHKQLIEGKANSQQHHNNVSNYTNIAIQSIN